MKIGYARVSTEEQNLAVQLEQLNAAGCEYIYQEKKSGKATEGRFQLKRMLSQLRPLDVVVVVRLDRLARSTRDLLELVELIAKSEAALVSLSEPWANTDSPAGGLIVTVMAGIADFERKLLLKRCADGIASAKARGVRFGRKPKLTQHQQNHAVQLLARGARPQEVADMLNVDVSTIYRFRIRVSASQAGGE